MVHCQLHLLMTFVGLLMSTLISLVSLLVYISYARTNQRKKYYKIQDLSNGTSDQSFRT